LRLLPKGPRARYIRQAVTSSIDEKGLEGYAQRIGLGQGLVTAAATDELLADVHLAHATSVPFENLDIHLGLNIRIEPDRVFDKLVVRRRGGYCFEQNGLLLQVLRAVGFTVRPLAARVLYGGGPARPRTHMALLVTSGGRQWLADVGFGTHTLLAPLPFEPGVVHEIRGETYRITTAHEVEVRLEGTWTPLYRLSLEEQEPVDFVMGNWFTSTHPSSLFVRSKVVSLAGVGKRTLLHDRELKVRSGGEVVSRTIDDDDEWLAVLRDTFGIELPDGALLRW
jgi:N-hydroxyarylamine O-acetyltransferase